MIKARKSLIIVLTAVVAAALAAAAIGIVSNRKNIEQRNTYERELLGRWAYVHDRNTAAASFKANGKAKFEGQRYRFSCDGERISFTRGSGEDMVLRYTKSDDGMVLYIKSLYVLQPGRAQNGVAGVWLCEEKNWTFEFTDKGTFMEDGILTGYYFVDEEKGVIQLAYEEALEDTFLYYQLTGEGLVIEYPWPMVKM